MRRADVYLAMINAHARMEAVCDPEKELNGISNHEISQQLHDAARAYRNHSMDERDRNEAIDKTLARLKGFEVGVKSETDK